MTVRAIHQLIPAAAPMDAVTQQAIAWRDAIRHWGIDGRILAEHIHPALVSDVEPIARHKVRPDEARVLHYSIWSEVAKRALETPPERLGVNYQNITPGRFFAVANPEIAVLCDRGRRELRAFAGRVAAPIAPSRFNAADLEAVGIHDVRIVPLLLPVNAPAPPRDTVEPVVLTVGRIVPNKRIEDVIRAFAVLRRSMPEARLEIVGPWEGFELYQSSLVRYADRLRVTDAMTFHGRISDVERDALYARAGAYLCMSEHEGFCAPLIEALVAGLPVVARGAGAVPETLGGAGLILPDGCPELAAEALELVLTSSELRHDLSTVAAKRLEELTPNRTEQMLRAALEPILF